MSVLKIEYDIAGKRFDYSPAIYFSKDQIGKGEFIEEHDSVHNYQVIMQYINFTNEKLMNALTSFAKQEVDAELAIENDFLVGLKITNMLSKQVHLDIHLIMNYKDGALTPKFMGGRIW